MLPRTPSIRPALLAVALTLVVAASTTLADEPQPQSMQAKGGIVTAPEQANEPAPRPLTPEEAALQQILAEGQAEVAELLAAAQADPSREEQIQREVVRVKTENRVRFLQALVDFARQRGDERGMQEAQAALENMLHPAAPTPAANEREQNDAKAREVRK